MAGKGRKRIEFTDQERYNRKTGRVDRNSSKFGKLNKLQRRTIDNIKKELENENLLSILGGGQTEYTYIHNNSYYASIGLARAQQVAEEALLGTVVPQVKAEIRKIIDQLNVREELFYKAFEDTSSNFVFNFKYMKQLYSKIAGKQENPETELEKIQNLLYALKENSSQIMTFTKEQSKSELGAQLKKEVDKLQEEFIDKLDKYIAQKGNGEKIKKSILEGLKADELIKMTDDGIVLSKQASRIWAAMGNDFEGIAADFGERVVEEVVGSEDFKKKVMTTVTWSAKEKGIPQSAKFKKANIGASDIVLTTAGVDAGISLKFRQSPVRVADEKGNITYKTKFFFGTRAEGDSIYDYNDKVLQGVGKLSDKDLSILQYGIYNSKAFLNLSGVEKFRNTVRQILGWQHIIKALIGVAKEDGDKKDYADSYTVFLGIGDQLYRTADVLGVIVNNFNPKDIEKMMSTGTSGSWENKFSLVSGRKLKATGDAEKDKEAAEKRESAKTAFKSGLGLLEKTKRQIVAQCHKNKEESAIYEILYNDSDVKQQIQTLFPKKDNAKIAVKYRIISENLLKGVL